MLATPGEAPRRDTEQCGTDRGDRKPLVTVEAGEKWVVGSLESQDAPAPGAQRGRMARRRDDGGMGNLAALILRAALGLLLAGHGSQKAFGWFNGPGLEGTSGFMEMLGLRPGRPWAVLASLSELGGGVLTALGLLNPVGPLGVIGAMSMATAKAHWGKPIWVTEGGAELPVFNIAASTALILGGPG